MRFSELAAIYDCGEVSFSIAKFNRSCYPKGHLYDRAKKCIAYVKHEVPTVGFTLPHSEAHQNAVHIAKGAALTAFFLERRTRAGLRKGLKDFE